MDPRNVDVNCDPCKAKVRILKDVEAATALRERIVSMLQTFEDTQKKVASHLQQALTGKEPDAKKAKKASPKEKQQKDQQASPEVVSKVMPKLPPSPVAMVHENPLVQQILKVTKEKDENCCTVCFQVPCLSNSAMHGFQSVQK